MGHVIQVEFLSLISPLGYSSQFRRGYTPSNRPMTQPRWIYWEIEDSLVLKFLGTGWELYQGLLGEESLYFRDGQINTERFLMIAPSYKAVQR